MTCIWSCVDCASGLPKMAWAFDDRNAEQPLPALSPCAPLQTRLPHRRFASFAALSAQHCTLPIHRSVSMEPRIASRLLFLYQTRTILRSSSCSTLQPMRHAQYLHQSTQPAKHVVDETSFFQRKANQVAAKYAANTPSTISRDEQRAFDRLRRLAGQRELGSQLGVAALEPRRLDVDPDRLLALFTPHRLPETHEEDTEPEGDHSPAATTKPDLQTPSAAETERIVHAICTSEVRSFAARIHDALNSTTQSSDIAIYNLLEQRIFPLLDLLAVHSRKRSSHSSNHTKDTNTNPTTISSQPSHPSPAHSLLPLPTLIAQHLPSSTIASTSTPPQISPLTILSRYYPTALLLAYRRLTVTHPLSPQTHRLLPTIRSLGPSSYILAATTPFYNTHLLLRWEVYSSLSEICSILAEMERGAVEFDRGTWRFLADVEEERAVALRDGDEELSTGRGREWWGLPEQGRWWPKVVEWKGRVARKLEERGLGEVLREGSIGGAGRVGEEEVEPQVWL